MARIAQPRETAELKGAHKVHPERYRGEVPKSSMPVGDAPEDMREGAQAVWFEISTFAPAGVLTGADRFMLEMASNLLAQYREDPDEFAVGKYGHLISLLARFGLSPSDRTKLAMEAPKEKNPFESLNG